MANFIFNVIYIKHTHTHKTRIENLLTLKLFAIYSKKHAENSYLKIDHALLIVVFQTKEKSL